MDVVKAVTQIENKTNRGGATRYLWPTDRGDRAKTGASNNLRL